MVTDGVAWDEGGNGNSKDTTWRDRILYASDVALTLFLATVFSLKEEERRLSASNISRSYREKMIEGVGKA